ncbi:BglG family transcription antiterminator [uncultured Helcococcus sp.]|uniref:BglG family transcription antiterminator n=1 Tax=uncultured Helcococcus sp. TaxID=1072508 RepID=UPI00288ACCA0|nr:BglG family transcription antiterminator [uncultured Helcococcus sp.]
MKNRQYKIFQSILQNNGLSLQELMDNYDVSKRTIYYDINEINYEIKEYGKIENLNRKFIYLGDERIYAKYKIKSDISSDVEYRHRYIIEKIFTDTFSTIDEISEDLLVSKGTIFNDIKEIKDYLHLENIDLVFNKKYQLKADELIIRDAYINYMYLDQDLISYVDPRILEVNRRADLHLTDYSISLLSKFVIFTDNRIKSGNKLKETSLYDDAKNFYYYNILENVMDYDDEDELKYLAAFVASMTKLKSDKLNSNIKKFVNELIHNFEKYAAVVIQNKDDFSKDITRHLSSSYYRLKFKFPIYNGSLKEIKKDYSYLMDLVKISVKNTNSAVFSEMRESEIGFLAMYFGARVESFSKRENRVVIVCPNGRVISKMLESQLYNYLPTINIVGVVSIHELDEMSAQFDYIISTIPLEKYNNVILVKPVLTPHNISILYEKLLNINSVIDEDSINQIIDIVKDYAEIKDEEKLKKALLEMLIYKNEAIRKADNKIMLSQVLDENRIRKIKKVSDWKEAINIGSEILLKEASIEKSYVEDMIESIEKVGPYVVISDGIAMPHAKYKYNVSKVDISILIIEEAVDMEGKDIDTFIILANLDNNDHIQMLSVLTDILNDKKSMEILKTADYKKVNKMIKGYED